MICSKKFSQERVWYKQVYKQTEPNEHEASQQAWWLSEDQDRDVSEALNYKGCRWYLPLPKG